MKAKSTTYKFVQWSSPDELHEACLNWISELEFIKDEQHFLDELIKDYTIQLISEPVYKTTLNLVSELSREEKVVTQLLDKVRDHGNKLKILLDGVNQLEEEKLYKESHYVLKMEVAGYIISYRKTKKEIFDLIKKIMKLDKQKKLSN